jgi:IS1 family transposase
MYNITMNKLSTDKRAQVIAALCEGNSVASTCRMTNVSEKTVLRLLELVGTACAAYQDKTLRNLNCKRLQADEIWSYVGAKAKNVPQEKRGKFGVGDVWIWTVIDADTKLIPCWFVGGRDAGAAYALMMNLCERLTSRVQLTTDGHKAYLSAVDSAFGIGIDYAMLVKIYGAAPEGETRYSPAVCIGAEPHAVVGNPDPKHISTSYVERQNLSMRMGMRRFTRLTNAFSKKLENHCHAVALYFQHYNFARIHQTLRVTPAMEAGIAGHVWTLEEIVDLVPEEDVVILK